MLHSLYIKNLAIIDELEINFSSGLNIITGETGAGKTLLIKAVQFLLGKRISAEMLRTGDSRLIVEGSFEKDGKISIIRRVYNKNGKSRNFLNEAPVKQSELAKITRFFIDMHGQHDHQNLLDPTTHLAYLDSFGDFKTELKNLINLFNERTGKQIELNKLQEEKAQLAEKKALYQFQLQELSQHEISEILASEINERFEIQSSVAEIKEKLLEIFSKISQSENSAINVLSDAVRSLESLPQTIESIQTIAQRLEGIRIDLEDTNSEIQSLENSIQVNPEELKVCEELLAYVEEMKRKYGGSITAAMEYREKISNELEMAQQSTGLIDTLQNEINNLAKLLNQLADVISKKRRETAKILESNIQYHLKNLNMPAIQFKIALTSDSSALTSNGIDRCEFLISTNIGEELRPVSKIASGGEISRIMLAIKMALQSRDMVDTLIFDEIDAGISGKTADKVGDTIHRLSESHQIICITHLAQIAGKGNCHFAVVKKITNNRVITEVNKLNPEERVLELASLISGSSLTLSSRKQAAELLGANG